jgi:elongation factor G
VEAKVGKPRVSYKQTIEKTTESEEEFIRDQPNNKHYAYVRVKIEPWNSEGKENVFFENKFRGELQSTFLSAIEKSVYETSSGGVGWGYPLINFKATLLEARQREDSSDIAFSTAVSLAIRKGVEKIGTVLLEPIMKIEITVPEEYVGEITKDLMARRAEIQEMGKQEEGCLIRCTAPLAKMFGYSTTQRSLSQGRANFTMEPYRYSTVHPDDVPQFF